MNGHHPLVTRSRAALSGDAADVVNQVSELVQRLGFQRTVQIGSADLHLAAALAQLHARTGTGHHAVIARDHSAAEMARTLWTSLLSGGGAHVTLIDESPEQALASLPTPDLVIIEESPRFEQVLVEFVLADRQLEPGAAVALMAPHALAMRGLADFVLQARAYERHSSTNAPVATLRKLGRQISPVDLVPASSAPETTAASGESQRPSAGYQSASAQHLRRRLVDAEQRAGEVMQLRAELSDARRELEMVAEQLRCTEIELRQLQTSTSWRVTAPLRRAMARIRR